MNGTRQRILISGASGSIGRAVGRALQAKGIEITTLVRKHRLVRAGAIYWNPQRAGSAIHPVALEGFDAVIHLSGANVARRWTERYREEIVLSRVRSMEVLCEAMAQVRRRPRLLLCASAVGLYGDRGEEVLTEESAPGAGFLAETCRAWEEAAEKAGALGLRVLRLRFSVVLDRRGGALTRLLPLYRCGLGGRVGSGQQWMSWISLPDAVRAILFLLDRDDLAGAFNVVAPNPVTNAEFSRALAAAVHRPAVLPAPAWALRLAFGQMADETLLASQRALPLRLQAAGFRFSDGEIGPALKALLR